MAPRVPKEVRVQTGRWARTVETVTPEILEIPLPRWLRSAISHPNALVKRKRGWTDPRDQRVQKVPREVWDRMGPMRNPDQWGHLGTRVPGVRLAVWVTKDPGVTPDSAPTVRVGWVHLV